MNGIRSIDVVREFFPDASSEYAHDILWSHTSFPFFRGSTESELVEELRSSLRTFKETEEKGGRACDFCNKPSIEGGCLCKGCYSSYLSMQVADRLQGRK